MNRLVTQLGRFVRIAAVAFGANSGLSQLVHGANTKYAAAGAAVAAVEVAYRQVVPANTQSRVAAFFRSVRLVYNQIYKQAEAQKS